MSETTTTDTERLATMRAVLAATRDSLRDASTRDGLPDDIAALLRSRAARIDAVLMQTE